MRAPSASQLLDVWESGLTQDPVRRPLTLLAAAYPDAPLEALSRLSVGERDARLLTLREWTFGAQFASLEICPNCGESLDFDFDVSTIRATSVAEVSGPLSLSVGDYEVFFRLPNSIDLAAVAGHRDVHTVRRELLQRCVLAARSGSEERPVDEVPQDVLAAVVGRMGEADPQANVEIALSCPLCRHEWQAAFDITSFFWSEIDAWAQRALREVHALAAAYGWREKEILSMSALRRQLYLEMAGR